MSSLLSAHLPIIEHVERSVSVDTTPAAAMLPPLPVKLPAMEEQVHTGTICLNLVDSSAAMGHVHCHRSKKSKGTDTDIGDLSSSTRVAKKRRRTNKVCVNEI